MGKTPAITIYEANSAALAARYDAVETESLLAGVLDLLPPPPAPVLDVGAGSGRDAAWFAARGHPVTAAEPAAGFRGVIAARLPEVTLADAGLPDLAGIDGGFGLILVNAVWHHLDAVARQSALHRLAALLRPSGRVLLSLRQGPVPAGQPVYRADPQGEIVRASDAGLFLVRSVATPAHDPTTAAAGITWVWLVLEKGQSDAQ